MDVLSNFSRKIVALTPQRGKLEFPLLDLVATRFHPDRYHLIEEIVKPSRFDPPPVNNSKRNSTAVATIRQTADLILAGKREQACSSTGARFPVRP
jgi:hypothetical protein